MTDRSSVPYQNISIFMAYIDIFCTGANEFPVRTGILLPATRHNPSSALFCLLTARLPFRVEYLRTQSIRKGTLPWAIFRFRIFLNCFSQKFEKIKITVWKSDNLTMYGNFRLDFYWYYYMQGRVVGPYLGPYIWISKLNKRFFPLQSMVFVY